MNIQKKINAVVIGASGYTGAELVRLLYAHPQVQIVALVADSNAGQPAGAVYPHLKAAGLPDLVKLEQVDLSAVDVAFCCLPHGTSQEVIASLPEHLKIIDLSADFRLKDTALYAEWYDTPHKAEALQREAVYGLTEHAREAIRKARLIACPGCYPTSVLLPVLPLLKAGMIDPERITVDAKSGISGAGRSAKVANLFAEMNENIKAYGVGKHRHMAEMDQQLSEVAGRPVSISFTPHVLPINRGILSTIYVETVDGKGVADVARVLHAAYDHEPFVQVHSDGYAPTPRDVATTNRAAIGVFPDRKPGRVILVSVIDNLVKGASGQAVQNMNLLFDLPETMGLDQLPVFP
ncbi:MAG: N-acetyl-gamma-glutamyl-phosphate reductase [Hyphomicrobiales bacterium]|nr:N-acetyl-gamma-glutamyl-phosphate reductase [Rickettsiales bacterium]MCP5361763.1 N-acetyl-gamma-glutamyl-phosphate reductase [Hyphomicrobiales bacterium]